MLGAVGFGSSLASVGWAGGRVGWGCVSGAGYIRVKAEAARLAQRAHSEKEYDSYVSQDSYVESTILPGN